MANSDVAFVFSSKDRVDFSLRSLESIDAEKGFDIVWVDGSDDDDGKNLPHRFKFYNCNLVEVHHNVKGGPDRAIIFGLKRLLSLGYKYCGLIENDIVFKQGWFSSLMSLFKSGKRDGLNVGAATVRTIKSRVLTATPRYAIKWCMGAGMVLFTREAAKIILHTYAATNARAVNKFYISKFGVALRDVWELWMDKPNRALGCDWTYAMRLYERGLCSLGSIPSLAFNIDCDLKKELKTSYVCVYEEISEYNFMPLLRLKSQCDLEKGRKFVSVSWRAIIYRITLTIKNQLNIHT